MCRNSPTSLCSKTFDSALLLALLLWSSSALAQGSTKIGVAEEFWADAEWGASFRMRHEQVDDNINEQANATTARVTGHFQSGTVNDWSLFAELEHVLAADTSSYNDGGANHVLDRATIADPVGIEINQLYARYTGWDGMSLKLGRHKLGYRVPLQQRYLGSVSFRQNEQTVDGVSVEGAPRERVEVQASYLFNVNRVFGEDNPVPTRANLRLSGLAGRAAFEIMERGKVEGFLYHMDFEQAPAFSTLTLGGRVGGEGDLRAGIIFYAFEYATQAGIGGNPTYDRSGYLFMQTGMRWPDVNDFAVQIVREALGGDGNVSFKTPTATLHAFQGWTDRFLGTPADGVIDTYGTLSATLGTTKVLFKLHSFNSDHDDYTYGMEWGAQVLFGFSQFSVGVKTARFTPDEKLLDEHPLNNETAKFWTWIQRKF